MGLRVCFCLLLVVTISSSAAPQELIVAFNEEGTVRGFSPVAFELFSIYYVAASTPPIDSWSAALEISNPVFTVVGFQPWNSENVPDASYGDFIVSLADCQIPATSQVLMRVDLIWLVSPSIPENEITICPFNPSLPNPTLPAYTACDESQSGSFAAQGMYPCAVLNGEGVCAPAVENTMALADVDGTAGQIVRVPLEYEHEIIRDASNCGFILICWFCGPYGGLWDIQWDQTIASFVGFEIDSEFANDWNYESVATPTTNGIHLEIQMANDDAGSMRTHRIGDLLLQVNEVAPGSSTVIEIDLLTLYTGSVASETNVFVPGSLTVLDIVGTETVSFGGLKSRF